MNVVEKMAVGFAKYFAWFCFGWSLSAENYAYAAAFAIWGIMIFYSLNLMKKEGKK